jgi:hypothetical protein
VEEVMTMESVKLGVRLLNEEREVHIYFDPVEKMWMMDAFVPKYFRKAIKQGWTPIREYIYEDGTVCGMSLVAPERAVSIRNVNKKQISEKQRNNLRGNK